MGSSKSWTFLPLGCLNVNKVYPQNVLGIIDAIREWDVNHNRSNDCDECMGAGDINSIDSEGRSCMVTCHVCFGRSDYKKLWGTP